VNYLGPNQDAVLLGSGKYLYSIGLCVWSWSKLFGFISEFGGSLCNHV